MTDEQYWNYPLKGKDGRIENGSRKYRDYYFEKNGDITNEELATHFNVSKSVIEGHKSNYQYDAVLSDKKAYEAEKRRIKREESYQKHLDEDNKNANIALSIKYKQIEMSAIRVGIIPGDIDALPDELTFDKAWDTINRIGIDKIKNIIMRNFEEPATINGLQKVEHAGELTTRNLNVNTDVEVDEIYENRFKEFINTAFGNND